MSIIFVYYICLLYMSIYVYIHITCLYTICRSCESPVVVSESKSPQYQQGTYISERISDSQVISRRSPTEPTSG